MFRLWKLHEILSVWSVSFFDHIALNSVCAGDTCGSFCLQAAEREEVVLPHHGAQAGAEAELK